MAQPILNKEDRIQQGPPTQAKYEALVDEMANLRMQKVLSYGEARYNDPNHGKMMVITYADIYRKMVRIDNVFANRDSVTLERDQGENMRDTLMDMANYALMMVQQIDAQRAEGHGKVAMDPEHLKRNEELDRMAKALDELNAKAVKPAPKAADLLVDQVAIVTQEPRVVIDLLNVIFGVDEWHHDRVVASGEVFGEPAINEANLAFNYQLMKGGVEFEVLHYRAGANWVKEINPTVSHLGVHVEQLGPVRERLLGMGLEIIQEVATESHTNPAIKDNRRYLYTIFATRKWFGFDLKLIQRMPYEPA